MATTVPATFKKETECPICSTKFQVEAVRSSKVRVLETWNDFGRKYSKEVNPLFYSTWTCPKCYYSGNANDEYKRVLPEIKVVILKHYKILKKFVGNIDFSADKTAESAVISLLLSALCYRLKRASRGYNASCYMRVAWIIRNEDKEEALELPFLKKALHAYKYAMTKEYSPAFGKLSEFGIFYIIGLLYYKLGDLDSARDYISKVVVNKKKVEAFILKFAEIIYDDIKNFKPVVEVPTEEISEEDKNLAWLNDLDLSLD
jgi:uncharacterized protein (DUF2225 family)